VFLTFFAFSVLAAGARAGGDDGLAGYRKAEPPAERVTLVNPGFETGTDGWNLPAGYRHDPAGGRNGTGALRAERSDPAVYTLCSQTIKLNPGGRYRFGAWVRTQGVEGGGSGATVCLEYSGVKGWMGGSYPEGVKGTRDWTFVEGIVQVPANAVSCTITPYLDRKTTGTAWFDDFKVEPESATWSAYLITPRRETLSPAGGPVVFGSVITGEFVLPPDRIGEGDLNCRVEAVTEKGAVLREVTAPVRGDRIVAAPGPLPEGPLTLRLRLLDTRRKLILGDQSIPVTVSGAAAPEGACVIDEAGRALVGGKPFLPVGLYLSDVKKEDIGRLAASPFNCVMPYASMSLKLDGSKLEGIEAIREVLDACDAGGIRMIFSLKDIFAGTKWEDIAFAGAKGEDAVVGKAVTAFRGHPAILAWYVNDELPTTMLDRLVARRRLVNHLDPGHPTWAVLFQFEELSLYGPTCDVMGVDPYPIENRKNRDMERVLQGVVASEKAVGTGAGMALWVVPQIFNWGCYHAPDRAAMLKEYRDPTEPEMRAMALLCALKGARGFVFYSYFDLLRPQAKPDFVRRWPEVCRVGKTLRDLEPFLLSGRPSSTVTVESGAGRVEARLFVSDAGRRCVLVAGIGPGESRAVLALDPGVKYRSKYGLTTSLGKGRWRFKGTDICADILEER
jgi:hypothetical protein